MATVNKNFRIKSGLVVEGTSGTIDGHNILTESTSGDQYILNLIGGETLVKSVSGNLSVDSAGELTINETGLATNLAGSYLYDQSGTINVDVEGLVIDGLVDTVSAQTLTNKTINGTDNDITVVAADVSDFTSAALSATASAYDASGSASAAQTAAQSYADGLAVNYDAAGAAATAESNAEFYTDNAIGNLGGSGTASVDGNIDVLTGTGIQVNGGNNSVEIDRQTVDTWYDASGSADAAQQAAELYTDNAVAALVDSAPATLDTLNELAAALQDNPDIIGDLQDIAAGKQNTLTAGDGIDIIDDTISVDPQDFTNAEFDSASSYIPVGTDAFGNLVVVDNSITGKIAGTGLASVKTGQLYTITLDRTVVDTYYDALGAADAAETDAISSAATYTDGQISNLTTGGNGFQTVNIDDIIAQQATFSESIDATQTSVFEWDASDYRSAKILVKVANGVHTQISELMVTLDDSNNVAISEYGITYSNGTELAAISADFVLGTVRVLATPANSGTDVVVFATLVI